MLTLYRHQSEALERTKNLNRVAYYHDQGLGKTFTGAEKMIQLGTKINLVICQKSKIQDWIDHFECNYNVTIYDLTDKSQFELFISDTINENLNHLVVGIINYDLVWRRKELLKLQGFTLMLDESSLIKHENTNRTKFILKFNAANVILLSGTPTGGKYEELWSQFHLLGWDISKKLYWKQYMEVEMIDCDGFLRPNVVGYKNVERLKRKLRNHGCDFLKTEDCIELPEQIPSNLFVPISKEYRKFRKDKIITIGEDILVGDNNLTKLLYERQLCGQYNNDKLEAFKDLVESTDDRLIVFYNFTHELHFMCDIVDNLQKPISIVNGQFKNLEHYETCSNSITFVQYQAGAMGLNLQKANKIVYFTPPLSSDLFEQSKKRIHRIGQTKTCFYYYLICKGSIEEEIYDTLALRKDYTLELFREDDDGRT